jgi:hypothetical protein
VEAASGALGRGNSAAAVGSAQDHIGMKNI